MEKKSRVLTIAAAAMLAGTTGMAFAQEAPATAPTAPAVELGFLAALFAGDARPDRDEVAMALAGTDLTLTRLSYAGNGDVRLRAVTADGQRIRVRIEDGELRYRIRPASGSSESSDTSDSNGATSDSNGGTTGSSDANGPTSGGRNGDRSGGGRGNGGGSDD